MTIKMFKYLETEKNTIKQSNNSIKNFHKKITEAQNLFIYLSASLILSPPLLLGPRLPLSKPRKL